MAATISLSNLTIVENPEAGAVVGTLSVSGGKDGETFTFSLADALQDRFEIKEVTIEGETKLALVVKTSVSSTGASLFDFENADLNDFILSISASSNLTTGGTAVDSASFTIVVSDVAETTIGTDKSNTLQGGAGADVLNGLGGNDTIYGNDGDDVINGGAGKDQLWGGAGKDTFVFDSPMKKGHFDHIKDFNSADDTIQFNLTALKAFRVKAEKSEVFDDLSEKEGKKKAFFSVDKVFDKGHLDSKFFSIGKPQDSNDFLYYNQKNGFVYLDADGSGRGKGIPILKLMPGTVISADDFVFI